MSIERLGICLIGLGLICMTGCEGLDERGALVSASLEADAGAEAPPGLAASPAALSNAAQLRLVAGANTELGDGFNQLSMSDDGTVLVAGANGEDSDGTGVNSGRGSNNGRANSGAVYIFRLVNGVWTQEAYLKASNPDIDDGFGDFVSISGDGNVVAVGVPDEDSIGTGINGATQSNNAAASAGAVYVFRRSNGTWRQEAYIKASNTDADDMFGWPVVLNRDGSVLAVGAPLEDSSSRGINGDAQQQASDANPDSGAVYLFRYRRGAWRQDAYIKASNSEAGDSFGQSLALSGDGNLLAVGASWEGSSATGVGGDQNNNAALESGAVYLFRAGARWSQEAYVKASNTDRGDHFGSAVALSSDGTTLAAGAYLEASDARGIQGDQSSNARAGSGAVYVHTRVNNVWQQQAYIKAANADAADYFGQNGVALSSNGSFLVVGAVEEDSSATGVGGNAALNDAPTTGAAYVFGRGPNATWSQQVYLKPDQSSKSYPTPSSAYILFGRGADISADGNAVAVSAFRGTKTGGAAFVFR